MYAYDELDRTLVNERVSEFRDQVKRRLSGELTEDEFKMLRLQNGVYLQLARLYVPGRHPLWHAVIDAAPAARPCGAAL